MSFTFSNETSGYLLGSFEKVISEIISHFDLPADEVQQVIAKAFGASSKSSSPAKKPLKRSLKKDEKKEEPVEEESKKPSSVVVTPETVTKMTKPELSGVCKSRGLKVSGTRQDLIDRILEDLKKGDSSSSTAPSSSSSAAKKQTTLTKAGVLKKEAATSVLKKIASTAPTLQIKRNKFGNYEHADTGLVFDKEDKMVIGKQGDDGNIYELDDEDIENCKRFKFNYTIPENLDSRKTGLDDVKVEEVDEELGEEDFEEEVEEEISDEEVDEE